MAIRGARERICFNPPWGGQSSFFADDCPEDPPKTLAAEISQSITNAYMMVGQDCSTVLSSDQSIIVVGSDNIVSGNEMSMALSFNLNCETFSQSDNQVQNNIMSAIQQSYSLDQEGGSTPSTDTMSIISNIVCNNFYNCTFVDAATTINADQKILVVGTGNVVSDNVLEASFDVMSQSLLGTTATNTAITQIANALSQSVSVKETGPLVAIMESIAMVIGLIVIVIIVAVIARQISKEHNKPKPPQAPDIKIESSMLSPAELGIEGPAGLPAEAAALA